MLLNKDNYQISTESYQRVNLDLTPGCAPSGNSTNKTKPIPGLASDTDNTDYEKEAYMSSCYSTADHLNEEKILIRH